MKVDLTGRNGQDIGPMLRNLWTYGETLELSPPGSYFSSPQVFPSLRPWGESRCAIEGTGVQGVEISPLPGIQWQAEQPMWLFTGGRSRVTNLMFSDHNTSHQRTFLQFGNGSTILSNCYVEALDLRQYRRGLVHARCRRAGAFLFQLQRRGRRIQLDRGRRAARPVASN